MGCCASRPSPDDDHPPSGNNEDQHSQQTSSRNNSAADPSVSTTSGRRRTRRPGPNIPLGEHYNEPVRLHVWSSKRRTWTRVQLDRERREFFETRVTGRPEVWAALSSTISLIRAGDLATAQSIVDAAGITIPTGDMCEGVYDEQGMLYRLPQCIVSDPDNMVQNPSSQPGSDNEAQDEDTEALSDGKLATDDDASGDELIAEDLERRRDEKGKTREQDLIRVQTRLSDRGGPDLMLLVGKDQSVGFLTRKIHHEAGLAGHQRVRIAYLGHVLKENESLPEQGWQSGHVINALIASRFPAA
ncbi:hypothetical protein N7474_000997 [Penicillium riverlandense]|uniref:uncharacterized protein n=1 Tax=Penicillium riverlandense TaxID=1903569 RepID=UPI00254897D6|nr:uncharacterized protein N7474_000997 [Penicillium riverlandense]KAJ5832686.1 hypothetical protein N7474_000997 [Penicillium riverlandense]